MSDELEFKIAKLNLGPEDVLVVKTRDCVPRITAERIKDHLKAVIGEHQRILVCDPSIDLAVLTRSEIEARTAPQSEDAA